MEPMKISMVSAEEIQTGANSSVMGQGRLSVDAIPDLDLLTSNIYEILMFLEKPATISLMKSNEGAVKMMLNQKYADSVPLSIITLLLEEDKRIEHVEILLNLFDKLATVKNMRDKDQALQALEKTEFDFTQESRKRYDVEAVEKQIMQEAEAKKGKVKYA